MPEIVVIVFVILLIGWLCAEAKGGRTARVISGFACMLMLILVSFSTSQRTALVQAQHNACFRLLGEALERQEYEKVTAAVRAYNQSDASGHPTFRMLDVLTGKE